MKIFSFLLGIILSLSLVTSSRAQDEGALQRENSKVASSAVDMPSDVKSSIDDFFTESIKKNYISALDKLLKNSPISTKDEENKNILLQLKKATEMYGDLKKYEIVGVRIVGRSYYRINILGLHQKYPTRWELTYYRSPDLGLIVSNIRFDDMSEEFFSR